MRLSPSWCVLFPLLSGLLACDGTCWFGDCGADDDDYYDSGSPAYGYDASYPSYPDAGRDDDCQQGFTASLNAPVDAGDCKVTLSRYGSPSGSSYGTEAVAAYAFPAPENDETVACETLIGPRLERCSRADGVVTLGTSREAIVRQLQEYLQTGAYYGTSFTVELSCTRLAVNESATVSVTCSAESPDAEPYEEDAGAGSSDASVDGAKADGGAPVDGGPH